MFKYRSLFVVSALSLASLTMGTQAFAREAQPQDDRGQAAQVKTDDRRGSPHIEVGDDRGQDAHMEDRHGADNRVGDDHGVDPQPHH